KTMTRPVASALVNDDVVVPRLGAGGVLVHVRLVGREGDRVAGAELERLVVDVHLELPAQHHDHLVGAGRVRVGRVGRARREPQLVELDERRRAGGGERTTLELAVGRAQHLRVVAPQDHDARARGADELSKRNSEAHRDLPEDADRGVALARLDLRESRATPPRRAGQVVERQASGLAPLPQVLGDAAPELGRADVVARARKGAIRLARVHDVLHYNEIVRWYTEISVALPSLVGGGPEGAAELKRRRPRVAGGHPAEASGMACTWQIPGGRLPTAYPRPNHRAYRPLPTRVACRGEPVAAFDYRVSVVPSTFEAGHDQASISAQVLRQAGHRRVRREARGIRARRAERRSV